MRAAGETPAQGREAPGRLRRPAGDRPGAARAVLQRLRREQRVETACGPTALDLGKPEGQAPTACGLRVEGKPCRHAPVLQPAIVMRDERAPRQVDRQPETRVAPGDAAANRHADLLFNIVSSRSQQNSTIITTNRPFAEWGEAFPNAACLVALVDRLVHNAKILAIDGDSCRPSPACSATAM